MMKIKSSFCVWLLFCLLAVSALPATAFEKIDINKATAIELTEVKGVGEVLAQRIVEYRQTHGDFKSLTELENVKGVGSKTLEKLLPYLTLSEG